MFGVGDTVSRKTQHFILLLPDPPQSLDAITIIHFSLLLAQGPAFSKTWSAVLMFEFHYFLLVYLQYYLLALI
jgi:hypothetical protein